MTREEFENMLSKVCEAAQDSLICQIGDIYPAAIIFVKDKSREKYLSAWINARNIGDIKKVFSFLEGTDILCIRYDDKAAICLSLEDIVSVGYEKIKAPLPDSKLRVSF